MSFAGVPVPQEIDAAPPDVIRPDERCVNLRCRGSGIVRPVVRAEPVPVAVPLAVDDTGWLNVAETRTSGRSHCRSTSALEFSQTAMIAPFSVGASLLPVPANIHSDALRKHPWRRVSINDFRSFGLGLWTNLIQRRMHPSETGPKKLLCSPFQAAGAENRRLFVQTVQHGRRWARQEARS